MGFLTKKDRFTLYAPIPPFVPRQLAIDLLHDHDEVLQSNPLVLEHWPTPCPPNVSSDEHQAIWYEIKQRIQYVPGIGSKGAGTINFTGCFQDRPWGLETHIYAPMGVDLRNSYRVAGFLPSSASPREHEASSGGLVVASPADGAPAEGLYVRTDVEVESTIGFSTFVRSQTKSALEKMIHSMVQRVENLDSKTLQESWQKELSSNANLPQIDRTTAQDPRTSIAASADRNTPLDSVTNVHVQGPPLGPGTVQQQAYELPASERA